MHLLLEPAPLMLVDSLCKALTPFDMIKDMQYGEQSARKARRHQCSALIKPNFHERIMHLGVIICPSSFLFTFQMQFHWDFEISITHFYVTKVVILSLVCCLVCVITVSV